MILLCDFQAGFLNVAHTQIEAFSSASKLLSCVLHVMLLSRPRRAQAKPAIEVASEGRTQLLTRVELYDQDLKRAMCKSEFCSVFQTTGWTRLVFDKQITTKERWIQGELSHPAPTHCNTAAPAAIPAP